MIRKIKAIDYSSHFARAIKRLSASLIKEVALHEEIFRHNCFDTRLKTHKLHGRRKEIWSFSITHQHRILFRFLTTNTIYFIDIGDHSIYQ